MYKSNFNNKMKKDEINNEDYNIESPGKLISNKRKHGDDELGTSSHGKKKKKLNSRLRRLIKIKNRRAAIPKDPKLSPLYCEKEIKWTELHEHSDSKSDDSGISSFTSDTFVSTCKNIQEFSNETLNGTVINSSEENCKIHIQSSSTIDLKISQTERCNRICDICVKKEIYSCACLKTTSHNQPNSQTFKKGTSSLSIIKDHDNINISNGYEIPPPEQIVALDCEFVGVHPKDTSALGRCSVVDFHGNVIYDTFVKPEEPITHYRTRFSGIRKRHMRNAVPFREAQEKLKNIIQDKVVVGHALHNDFKVIKIHHVGKYIRDTSKYKPLRAKANLSERTSASLKNLSKNLLERHIQQKEHCSVEDCRATLDLYKLVRDEWEQTLLNKTLKQEEDTHVHNNKTDTYCDTKTFFSDEYWPQYLFPSSDYA